jgi:hypothetical protein
VCLGAANHVDQCTELSDVITGFRIASDAHGLETFFEHKRGCAECEQHGDACRLVEAILIAELARRKEQVPAFKQYNVISIKILGVDVAKLTELKQLDGKLQLPKTQCRCLQAPRGLT